MPQNSTSREKPGRKKASSPEPRKSLSARGGEQSTKRNGSARRSRAGAPVAGKLTATPHPVPQLVVRRGVQPPRRLPYRGRRSAVTTTRSIERAMHHPQIAMPGGTAVLPQNAHSGAAGATGAGSVGGSSPSRATSAKSGGGPRNLAASISVRCSARPRRPWPPAHPRARHESRAGAHDRAQDGASGITDSAPG